ncbi:DUF1761 family protein [Candidatus Berkiella aquae]|uniref:DUF1761 domain-containing protein n=1 Tax=Candidatus Berkiella aquae TaxID=295108 RepID=A0A0Q9YWL4_9GAMM|nr:DUF1761 domain-containing protein [Candidatus Berkiella aquae]MCS5710394.1 DUF1761 domain-containing protein [Candidatus Berkiella aquae]
MLIQHINIIAVIVAALSALVISKIWYICFEVNPKRAPFKLSQYCYLFMLSFIAALAMALLLARKPGFYMALHTGILAGLCWVGTSLGITYAYANRSIKLFLIDAGYHAIQFVVYGIILGLWR